MVDTVTYFTKYEFLNTKMTLCLNHLMQIFDAPSLGKHPFEHRVTTITDYFKQNPAPYVHVLEHEKCRGVQHLKEELKRVEGKGGEGLMIREPKSTYENRMSNTLLKIKTFHDAEVGDGDIFAGGRFRC